MTRAFPPPPFVLLASILITHSHFSRADSPGLLAAAVAVPAVPAGTSPLDSLLGPPLSPPISPRSAVLVATDPGPAAAVGLMAAAAVPPVAADCFPPAPPAAQPPTPPPLPPTPVLRYLPLCLPFALSPDNRSPLLPCGAVLDARTAYMCRCCCGISVPAIGFVIILYTRSPVDELSLLLDSLP